MPFRYTKIHDGVCVAKLGILRVMFLPCWSTKGLSASQEQEGKNMLVRTTLCDLTQYYKIIDSISLLETCALT